MRKTGHKPSQPKPVTGTDGVGTLFASRAAGETMARFDQRQARKPVYRLMPRENSEVQGDYAEGKASRLEVVIERGQAQLLSSRQIKVGGVVCRQPVVAGKSYDRLA